MTDDRLILINKRHWKCVHPHCVETSVSGAYKVVHADGRTGLEDHQRPTCRHHRLLMVHCPKDEYDARRTVH